jgi:hypothetical protein
MTATCAPKCLRLSPATCSSTTRALRRPAPVPLVRDQLVMGRVLCQRLELAVTSARKLGPQTGPCGPVLASMADVSELNRLSSMCRQD